jgi:hypothetical protein
VVVQRDSLAPLGGFVPGLCHLHGLSKLGGPPQQWLVYAHSPLADRKAVSVIIPEYRQITIDIPVAGAFYQVVETTGTVEPL